MKMVFSYVLVMVQLSLLLYLGLTGPVFVPYWYVLPIQGVGVLLGLWAVLYMHFKGRFSALPEPKKDTTLITGGPYRYIRNPMYTSILLEFVPSVMAQPSLFRIAILILEVLVLYLKIVWEENLLAKKFQEYSTYAQDTYRLIPGIF